MITKEDFNKTPDQLRELIAWREQRSSFWTAFAKQTQRVSVRLERLSNANAHAKVALDLNAELNNWS
jgi:hypothetical protein